MNKIKQNRSMEDSPFLHAHFQAFSNPGNHSFIMGNTIAPKWNFLAKTEATGTENPNFKQYFVRNNNV